MWGRGFHQRSQEELLKIEAKPGPPGSPPKRPRTWLGAAGVLFLILGAALMVLVSDCRSDEEAQDAVVGISIAAVPVSVR